MTIIITTNAYLGFGYLYKFVMFYFLFFSKSKKQQI